jgi:hypothetical protein
MTVTYKYLNPSENVGMPPPQKNAGLYADLPYTQTERSKTYAREHIQPDAVSYSKHYFELARHHIPTGIRPGNNTLQINPYTFSQKHYNRLCYKS